MWLEKNESGETDLYYYTIDVYRTSTIIKNCSSPITLGDQYSPLWSCDVFYKVMVF